MGFFIFGIFYFLDFYFLDFRFFWFLIFLIFDFCDFWFWRFLILGIFDFWDFWFLGFLGFLVVELLTFVFKRDIRTDAWTHAQTHAKFNIDIKKIQPHQTPYSAKVWISRYFYFETFPNLCHVSMCGLLRLDGILTWWNSAWNGMRMRTSRRRPEPRLSIKRCTQH